MITDPKIMLKLEKIAARYMALRFEAVATVRMEMCETRQHFRAEPPRSAGLTWRPAPTGTKWGGEWRTGWFRGNVTLSRSCRGRRVFIRAATGGPETLFLVDGVHRGVFDVNHPVRMMTGKGVAGRKHHLSFEAYSGHTHPGALPDNVVQPQPRRSRTFESVDVVLEREDVSAFAFDLTTLWQLARAMDENSLRRNRVVRALADVYAAIDAMPSETGESSWREKLAAARKIMRPVLATKNGPTAPRFGLIGNSHIDTAWLWPLAETWRKCARTFSSLLNLMEQYPEFTFVQSAPCHTDVLRREYPGIFRRIKKKVAEGTWEPNGGMWVEPDANIPSGESFVRQFLVGQAATREMFGYTSNTLWLPDVFGYSASLPQIMRDCGVEYFCTQKMSWNDTTRLPVDTFVWRGLDGSAVITHFITNYVTRPNPESLTAAWKWVQHKDVQDRRLCVFGFGDGGGGPTAEQIELSRRVGDLEGCPRTTFTTVGKFMDSVRDELTDLPVWAGELYLELHRGTLTSIAKIKRGNRRAEVALREAELWSVQAALLRGAKVPAAKLLDIWKRVLTNQFHDILPGSSIAEVNDEAVETFDACIAEARGLAATALKRLAGRASGKPSRVLVANSLSWDRTGEMVLDDVPTGTKPADATIASQWIIDVRGRRRLVISGLTVPALGAAVLEMKPGRSRGRSPFTVGPRSVETPHAKVRFDAAGRIVSLLDKASRRQVVRKGGALNALTIAEDIPTNWDNWDIDADHELKRKGEKRLVARKVIANGPLQLRIRSTYRIGEASTLTQDMVFHATGPQIDFETVIDWAETHKLLKACFDLDVLADFARHEIQYGHAERPTHRNLPQDRARFEVCAHKWTDLSEGGFGVALLNDCKYGVSVRDGEIGLSLIKSGTHPDARGDAGTHDMTYSLLPHACGFSVESVVRPAYELNVPPTVTPAGAKTQGFPSLLTVDAPNVIIESVKQAERGNAFVVRLYEAGKTGTHVNLTFHTPVESACETDMLEENPRELRVKDGKVRLYLRPFEIKTIVIPSTRASNV